MTGATINEVIFNARFIDGRAGFPWDSILRLAGFRSDQERVPRLGVIRSLS